jgi:tetratricopeptide (TPR) repeat protein
MNRDRDNGARIGFRFFSRKLLIVCASIGLAACAGPDEKATISLATPAVEPVTAPEPAKPISIAQPELRSALGGYLAGRQARREQDGAAASKYFIQALIDDSDNPDILNSAFLALHNQGRMSEAVILARRLIDIRSTASIAGLTLAIDGIMRGQFDEASELLEKLPLQGYNSLLVPLLSAWVAVGQERFATANAKLDGLDSNQAFFVFRDFHRGLINDLAGVDEIAERSYLAAYDIQSGGSYRTVTALGRFYERGDRPSEAIILYEDYLENNPDSLWFEAAMQRVAEARTVSHLVGGARDGAAEALFGVASALLQENASKSAIIYARLAVHLKPEFDAGNMLLGEIFEAFGNYEEAIAAFELIPGDSPLYRTARLKIANDLDDLDRTDGAVSLLRRLAAERPERSDALISLGDMLRGQERWLESVAAYDEAFERIGVPEQRHWRPLYARGISLERSRQWPRAEKDFLTALDLVPDQPFVLNYLGYSWVDQGIKLKRALEMIERAVDLRPDDGYIIDSLGWAHYRLGNYQLAVNYLEQAAEVLPGDSTINDHLGDALWQVGRRNEAGFQWQRAIVLGTDEDADIIEAIKQKLEHGLLLSPVADGAG